MKSIRRIETRGVSSQKAIDKGEDVGQNMIYIGILGYLIHFVPTAQGLKTVVYEIGSCNEESVSLLAVGKMYYEGVYAPKSTCAICHLTRSLS